MNTASKILAEKYTQIAILTEETKQEFNELLQKHILLVTFIKVNGEKRLLRCTLKPDLVPPPPPGYSPRPKAPNPDVVPVYDLDNNGWRSFQVNSVTGYKIES